MLNDTIITIIFAIKQLNDYNKTIMPERRALLYFILNFYIDGLDQRCPIL